MLIIVLFQEADKEQVQLKTLYQPARMLEAQSPFVLICLITCRPKIFDFMILTIDLFYL